MTKSRRLTIRALKSDQEALKKNDMSFLDEDSLKSALDITKYLLEKQVNLLMVMVSYDQPLGHYRLTSSMKFYQDFLKTKYEQPVIFLESCFIKNSRKRRSPRTSLSTHIKKPCNLNPNLCNPYKPTTPTTAKRGLSRKSSEVHRGGEAGIRARCLGVLPYFMNLRNKRISRRTTLHWWRCRRR